MGYRSQPLIPMLVLDMGLYSEGGDFGGNTLIGHQALTNQSGSAGGRMENTAVGASGASVTTATRSVFIGVGTIGFTTTGLYNTMIGWSRIL